MGGNQAVPMGGPKTIRRLLQDLNSHVLLEIKPSQARIGLTAATLVIVFSVTALC